MDENRNRLGEVERRLRKLIIGTIIINFGYAEEFFPRDVLKSALARKRIRDDKVNLVRSGPSELVDFFNFGDYLKIFTFGNNWKAYFSKIFPDEKVLYTKLKELEIFRNDLAHQREINLENLSILNTNATYVLKCISENMFDNLDLSDGIKTSHLLETYKCRADILEKLLKIIAETEEPTLVSISKNELIIFLNGMKKIITVEHILPIQDIGEKINRLLLDYDFSNVKKGIILIDGPQSIDLDQIGKIGEKLTKNLPEECQIIWSAKTGDHNFIKLQVIFLE